MFFAWTFLYGLVRSIRKKKMPNLWLIFSLGLGYGLLVEVLQLVLPTNRSFELLDFIADGLGSAVAVLVLWWLLKKHYRK